MSEVKQDRLAKNQKERLIIERLVSQLPGSLNSDEIVELLCDLTGKYKSLEQEKMNLEEEINALRASIKKRYFSSVNKNKLSETTKKSLNSLSDEEREFLKNIGKL